MDNTETTPKKKLKRHFWLWPLLIGLGLTVAGQIAGLIMAIPLNLLVKDPMWQFSIQYAEFIGIVIVVLVFCVLFEKPVFRLFFPAGKGGLKGNTLKELLLGIGIGFLMNGGCIFLAWLHGDLHFSVGRFLPVYLIVTFFCVMIQSSAEEMVTRGYIYHAHAERYPAWVAIFGNSLLFGILHLGNEGITVLSFLQIFFCGVAFSLVIYSRQSLWMAYGIHTMWNFTQSILFGLANSGIVSEGSFLHLEAASGSFFYDTGFGIEGGAMSVIAELLLCGWCIYLIFRNKKKEEKAASSN
ncbi:MAG: CPBP family intramembrane metalloprotease [Clostridiales bacterium]|nr:CPBP family intramembrane metalloprotease [Clostridiales bacterium]